MVAPSPSPCGEERISSATPCAVGSPSRPASGHAPSAVAAAEPSPPFGWTAASLESLRRRGAVELSTNTTVSRARSQPPCSQRQAANGWAERNPFCFSWLLLGFCALPSARCASRPLSARPLAAQAARCPPAHLVRRHFPPRSRGLLLGCVLAARADSGCMCWFRVPHTG